MKKKLVLAFSGGLDTTFCAIYLSKKLNYEVHAALVNTGGFNTEEITAIKNHATHLGLSSFTVLEESENYFNKIVKHLIYGNILKNNTYPLSVSAERIAQAIAIAKHAKNIGATAVAHGSTGAGNDQVRFDMAFQIICPEIEIITPIRDLKLSREAEIEFLKENGIYMNFEKAQYSINKGIWGTSVGGKETLGSRLSLPDSAYPTKISASEPCKISISFENGLPVKLNDKSYAHPVALIQDLEQIAAPYGIGRDIHVGDTIIGIKGRVGFEAAAPILIIKAHHQLEKHTLTKWQLYWKDQLASWYGNWLHEGQFLDPVMRDLEAFMNNTQDKVSGTVYIQLEQKRFEIEGIESPNDLMSAKFGSYGEMNNAWTGDDVKGFAKIFGNQMAIYYNIHNQEAEVLA